MPYQPLKPDEKLSSVYVKRAAKELNEDPKQTAAHLTSIRRWLSSMPHLTCPTDDTFLMAFLRHAKYSHAKAQKRIDNFCTFRTSEKEGYPALFQTDEADLDAYERALDMKTMTPLGFADNGTFCFLVKMANFDLEAVSPDKIKQFNQAFNDHLLYDPRVQIAGVGMVFDYTGFSVRQSKAMYKPKTSRLETKYYQEAFPLRVNRMVFYNMPAFFDATYKLIEPYLKEKIRSRIMMLHDNLQPAYDALPGLQKLMPKEYGGSNKTFDELHAENRQAMLDLFNNPRRISLAVDESKRPETSKNLMRVYADPPTETMGKQGTFVKLADDEI